MLFFVTLRQINLADTIDDVLRLGFAFPAILLPGCAWHFLRTWGWWVAFPDNARPSFTRLFRVRLAADAISFFTVRGLTGELESVARTIDGLDLVDGAGHRREQSWIVDIGEQRVTTELRFDGRCGEQGARVGELVRMSRAPRQRDGGDRSATERWSVVRGCTRAIRRAKRLRLRAEGVGNEDAAEERAERALQWRGTALQ